MHGWPRGSDCQATRPGCASSTSTCFGESLINVWFIVFGVWLYARYKGEPFAKHINTAFFGAALAPIVTEILFSSALRWQFSLPLAVVTTVLLGFTLVPVAANLFKATPR